MRDLVELRKQIDYTDTKLVEIFEERMKITLEIAEYKKKNHMEVLNKNREEQVITNCKSYLKDKKLNTYIEKFFNSLMEISREVQEEFFG